MSNHGSYICKIVVCMMMMMIYRCWGQEIKMYDGMQCHCNLTLMENETYTLNFKNPGIKFVNDLKSVGEKPVYVLNDCYTNTQNMRFLNFKMNFATVFQFLTYVDIGHFFLFIIFLISYCHTKQNITKQ